MRRLFELLVLMSPAYLANMAPPFLRFWPGPNPPISRRWLGDHKTVGGFVVGALAGAATAALLFQLDRSGALVLPEPIRAHWLAFGLSLGLAALTGDSLKSFVKRRLDIAPGSPWIPFDQLDFVVAALAVLALWVDVSVAEALVVLVLSFAGDLIINRLSFRWGIKRDPW